MLSSIPLAIEPSPLHSPNWHKARHVGLSRRENGALHGALNDQHGEEGQQSGHHAWPCSPRVQPTPNLRSAAQRSVCQISPANPRTAPPPTSANYSLSRVLSAGFLIRTMNVLTACSLPGPVLATYLPTDTILRGSTDLYDSFCIQTLAELNWTTLTPKDRRRSPDARTRSRRDLALGRRQTL